MLPAPNQLAQERTLMKWLLKHQSEHPKEIGDDENYLLVAEKGNFAASDTLFSSNLVHRNPFVVEWSFNVFLIKVQKVLNVASPAILKNIF